MRVARCLAGASSAGGLMKVLLLRHGPVDLPSAVCYGRLDVPWVMPSSRWLEGARCFIQGELGEDVSWWSSTSSRAWGLAELLAGAPVRRDHRLMELSFGALEGRAWKTIDMAETQEWTQGGESARCAGGESFLDLQRRVEEVLAIWKEQSTPIACVCHGGPIRALLRSVLGIPYENLFKLRCDYACATVLEYGDAGWNVCYTNRALGAFGDV